MPIHSDDLEINALIISNSFIKLFAYRSNTWMNAITFILMRYSMLGGVMTTLSSMTNVTHRHTSESSSKENVCAKGAYLIILCVEGLFYITNILVLFFFCRCTFLQFRRKSICSINLRDRAALEVITAAWITNEHSILFERIWAIWLRLKALIGTQDILISL